MKKSAKIRGYVGLMQTEQYELSRYMIRNPTEGDLERLAARLEWTRRALLTKQAASILGIIFSAKTAVSLSSMPFTLAVYIAKKYWYWRTARKIARLKKSGLKVVVIAGSYAKSSVRHYAKQILSGEYQVVATPESYNTLLGISKVVEWELDERTKVFLCEVGAYRRGEIANLLIMLQPEFGILTGISSQHLERFGSRENIRLAKLEIADYIKSVGGTLLANGSDQTVRNSLSETVGLVKRFYGAEGEVRAGRTKMSLEGTVGSLIIREKEFEFETPVLGEQSVNNIEAGVLLATLFGISEKKSIKRLKTLSPLPHRFEFTRDRYTVPTIDNAYSSNETGFVEAVKFLSRLRKFTRILVSPGLVEIGEEEGEVHRELGKLAQMYCDRVILVGDSERVKEMGTEISAKKRYHVKSTLEFVRLVKSWKLNKPPLVLLENDVTVNYEF